MSKPTPLFVGLDVHKDSIAVAHARGQTAAGRRKAACANAFADSPHGDAPERGRDGDRRELIAFMWAIAKEIPMTAYRDHPQISGRRRGRPRCPRSPRRR